jgi:hypothetical protein
VRFLRALPTRLPHPSMNEGMQGYPSAKIRSYEWGQKAKRRKTTGTGRMSYLKVHPAFPAQRTGLTRAARTSRADSRTGSGPAPSPSASPRRPRPSPHRALRWKLREGTGRMVGLPRPATSLQRIVCWASFPRSQRRFFGTSIRATTTWEKRRLRYITVQSMSTGMGAGPARILALRLPETCRGQRQQHKRRTPLHPLRTGRLALTRRTGTSTRRARAGRRRRLVDSVDA